MADASDSSRRHSTQQQLREKRQAYSQRSAEEAERRLAEQQVRQHRHDAFAKTISAGELPERRRYRSDRELRGQRKALEDEWAARQRRRLRQKT